MASSYDVFVVDVDADLVADKVVIEDDVDIVTD